MNIEFNKFGDDLSSPIAEPAAEIEEFELYAGSSWKVVLIRENMDADLK